MIHQLNEKDMTTTQLTPADIRKQISELEKVRIMVCDISSAFDAVNEAIKQLKITHNELTGFRRFNVGE